MSGEVCSVFEGTEKKLELTVDPALASFRESGDAYWNAVVRTAGADVISKLSNEHCDAYVLSESSLFVFDHRVVMMTCGRTTLHDAVLAILERTDAVRVRSMTYKRKHEVFPHDQPTSFFDDVRVLRERLPGRAYQFGNRDEHHLYVYHVDRVRGGDPPTTTVEVLMHGLGERVRDDFRITHRPTTAEVRAATDVHRLLQGFEVDDFLFQPNGYSLNALRGDEYYAVHVTPETGCSYASFETNHRFGDDLEATLGRLLGVFRPRSWDLVLYDGCGGPRVAIPGYRLRSHAAQQPGHPLDVRFLTFYRPQRSVMRAVELQLG